MTACCKVGEVIERYPLERTVVGGDIDEYLLARWRGEDDYPETGIRPLADWFNERLLKEVYSDHGRTATETRIDSEYEALNSDDEVRRGEILDDLRADGIDGRELVEDFVSPSTLYRHFRNCLGAEKSGSETADASAWEREKVEYASGVARENALEALQSLDNKGRLPGAIEAGVDVSVTLSCPECATSVRFETALERGFVCRDHLGERGGDGETDARGTDAAAGDSAAERSDATTEGTGSAIAESDSTTEEDDSQTAPTGPAGTSSRSTGE